LKLSRACDLDAAMLQAAVDAYEKHGTQPAAAAELGIPRTTLSHRLALARAAGFIPNGFRVEAKKFDVPRSYATPREDKRITGKHRVFFISDLHVPYHDERAVEIALNECAKYGPTILVIGGDGIDLQCVSQHDREPGHRRLSEELETMRAFLKTLREGVGNIPIYYIEGNHEYRLPRFIMKHAAEFAGISEITVPNLLHLPLFGIEYMDKYHPLKLGDLNLAHGDEWRTGAENIARVIYNKAQDNVLFGNFHRTQEHIHRSLNQKIKGAWSVGCLCDLFPRWFVNNGWNHGFAEIDLDGDFFYIRNRTIINGRVFG
jgi:UDP-2,3-diacylglucosamine pyrophosphatase LpxH